MCRRLILLFVSSVDCSVILVTGNWALLWALLQIKKWQNYCGVLDLFCLNNILAKPRTKMTSVSRFSRQNDVGLRALSVVLWENLVLVVVLVLESKSWTEQGNALALLTLHPKSVWNRCILKVMADMFPKLK